MRVFPILGLLTMLLCPLVGAEDFCAVQVHVSDQAGNAARTQVQLFDAAENLVQGATTRDGSVEFCDFGFGTHTIRVGENGCFTTITSVRLVYSVPQDYRIVHGCPAPADAPRTISGSFPNDALGSRVLWTGEKYVPACRVYLRISSESGKKVGEAVATGEGLPNPISADVYGRIFFYMQSKSVTKISISAPGYAGESFNIDCRGDYTERATVLHASP
jgi:hypothetical protein